MFTGLVETKGRIAGRSISGKAGRLLIVPDRKFEQLQFGESIAVNGVCLTLEKESDSGQLEFHTLEETLKRTNLGEIPLGGRVNLERALRVGDRMGGHYVTGHIDTTAALVSCKKNGSDVELRLKLPSEIVPFMAPKGSIAIDGVSLTLVDIGKDSFSVHLIPVTLDETALGARKTGDRLNLEADILGKYVQHQLSSMRPESGKVSMESLINAGW